LAGQVPLEHFLDHMTRAKGITGELPDERERRIQTAS